MTERKTKFSIGAKILIYAMLALFLLWVLAPFYVILSTSLISSKELTGSTQFVWFPQEGLSFQAYTTVLFDDILAIGGMSSILRGFLNSMWMTVPTLLIGLFVSGLAAYAYAKLRFRAKNILYFCTLATMMIPTAVMTMPSYLFYDVIGWSHGPLPIIIPGMFGGAACVFFLRQFFSGIPNDLIEAGKLDGIGYFRMYVSVMLPLSVPALLAQGILMFVGGYNNYLGPLLYITDDKMYPLQLALSIFQGVYYSEKAIICASAVLALVPILVIYCTMQRFFIQGIALSGVKI